MADHVRWGILGAAKFAREFMGPALNAAPNGRLAAVATQTPEKAAHFQSTYPGIRVHRRYAALLADPDIDAVYIPLPNSMHVEWTKKAIEAGKHVLVEKPIAMKASEIDELISLRNKSGKLVAEAYMIVHHPQWIQVKQLIAEGAIGPLSHIDAQFMFKLADFGNIRGQSELGGGALRDIGVYPFGAARFVTGLAPTDVAARIKWHNGVDVRSNVWANFGGASFSAMLAIECDPYQEMSFHGPNGSIRVTTPFNASVYAEPTVILQKGLTQTVFRYGNARQYDIQVSNFNNSVLTGAPYQCPLEFSVGTQAMIDAVFKAAQRG